MTIMTDATALLHQVVGPDAAPRAVIVQGWPLPAAEEALLREALTAGLGACGRVARLAFADDKRTAAVVVFDKEAAAARAVEFTGPVLGASVVVTKPVVVVSAFGGDGDEERLLLNNDDTDAARRLLNNAEAIGREEETALPMLAQRAADVCATALAESVLLAQKGLEAAKEIDGKVGVTRRLHSLDEEKGLSRQAKAAAEKLSARAQELDDKLKLREGLRDTADRAKVTAAVLSGRAAELSERVLRQNPTLAQGAQKTSKLINLAEAWGKRTLDQAKQHIVSRGGVVPGSARGEDRRGSVGGMGEYEPLVSSDAGAEEAGAAGVGDVLSPGEEEVPIQL